MTCVDCGRPMRPKHASRDDHPGTVGHHGRGLCGACHTRHRGHGTLSDYPLMRTPGPWTEYADDYAMLRREGYPLDVIASRLGMHFDALDRALCRHRSDLRARRPGEVAS